MFCAKQISHKRGNQHPFFILILKKEYPFAPLKCGVCSYAWVMFLGAKTFDSLLLSEAQSAASSF